MTAQFTRSERMTIRLMALAILDTDPCALTLRAIEPILDKTADLEDS